MFNDFFVMVVRIFFKGDNRQHSVQYFTAAEYADTDELLRAVKARFHNIIAADLMDTDVTYQQTYAIDFAGNYVEKPVIFDRRPKPEPPTPPEQAAE